MVRYGFPPEFEFVMAPSENIFHSEPELPWTLERSTQKDNRVMAVKWTSKRGPIHPDNPGVFINKHTHAQ